ncbi:MAG: nucleotide exchange factor GrpE [Acidaminococcus sp.]|jgi:molecular chaperone GrpE|nr:nucleotide exchange factor GrpE [Acidaminococcus sp.]MCI2115994.1 nucleotide exchange factor GrpE [Acidaminococcus sp.]
MVEEEVKNAAETATPQADAEDLKKEPAAEPESGAAQEKAATQDTETKQQEAETKEETKEEADPRDAEIASQKQQIEELTNRLMRLQADFDNFRRRNNEERERLGRFVTANVAREFLKVLDNFERAEASMEKNPDGKTVAEGMGKIHKQFEKALKTLNIEEIPAQGQQFDPQFHEAVMQGNNPDLPDESIDLVLEKGYKIGDDIIRHSKVRVVRN